MSFATPPDPIAPSAEPGLPGPERISTGGRTLREHTARGTLVNGAFLAGLATLNLLSGFIVAAFLTKSQYGVWGILVIGLGTLEWLKGTGIADKYIQQSEEDQQLAFQKAFTLELMLTGCFVALLVPVVPLLALVYGRSDVLLPGAAVALLYVPLTALQSPLWIFYRRMEFVRQRRLQAIAPVINFVTTVGLAIAGAGYWSLVAGAIAGGAAGALVAMRALPYPLALRYDRGTLGEYWSFGGPLLIAGGSALVVAQGSILVGNAAEGIVAVGIISLASQIVGYIDGVDGIVTQTLYPAICAVAQRTELLFESFVKSNRLALMWGLPFGIGLALFARDVVHFGLGDRWRPAIGLLEAFGLIAASHQLGFNWTAFFRARGETRPIAVVNVATMLLFLAAVVPLTLADGIDGYAAGMAIMTAGALVLRSHYVRRLFPRFPLARQVLRAFGPVIPATAIVLAARAVESGTRTAAIAAGELVAYALVTLAATVLFERALLREALSYLRLRGSASAAAST